MADSRLLAELRQTLVDSSVDEYINKIQNQDTDNTYKAITALLQEESKHPTWLPVHTAWQSLQELTNRLLKRDKTVTPLLYDETIQKVAATLAAVPVNSETLTTAKLLAYTFKGLNNRNAYLDGLTGWNPKAMLAQTATKAMINFNGKNRQQNLKPVLDATEVLHKKVIDMASRPEPVVNNEAPSQTAALEKTEPSVQNNEEKAKPPFSEEELKQIIESLAFKLLKYKTNYLSSAAALRSIDPETAAAEQIEKLCENLNLIKETTTMNLTLADRVNSSLQHFLAIHAEEPEYKRLAVLEQEIEAKIKEGKVIPYDEKLAIDCHLSQDQKDAWRQHSYINYESTLSLKSLYNRMRETAGLVHSAPVLGSLSHLLSGAARHLPGAHTVMGAQTDYKQAMIALQKAVHAAKNEKIDYLRNLQEAFADSCHIGKELVEQTEALLSSSRRIQAQLQTKEEKLEKAEELNQKIAEVKTAVNTYIKANDGLFSRLARKVFGIGADDFKIATELKTRLEKSETITDAENLRAILDQAKMKLSNEKGKNQLTNLISSIR